MPSTTFASDPIVGFSVGVDIAGAVSGFFTEVSGMDITTEVIDHWTKSPDGKQTIQRKVPGRTTYGDISLKRGVVESNKELYDWHKLVRDGKVKEARKDGSVYLLDQAMTEVARWNFKAAWPSKVSMGTLGAEQSSAVVEELTISVEHVERVS